MTNTLYYGDNLNILREYIADDSVDLVYLDPPFNSNRTYNVLFKSEAGQESEAQIAAFEDTWHWTIHTEQLYSDLVTGERPEVGAMIEAMRGFIGENQMMAYLVMMAIRLVELHRVLKPTGSLYLHCDPTASHYLKIVLDTIFGVGNYRNEIIWRRSNPKSHGSVNFPTCTDTIFRYSKSGSCIFHPVYEEHDPIYVEKAYRYEDEKGRYRLLPLLNPNDDRPNLTYEFLGVTRVWRWTRERMQKAYEDGIIVQTKPGAVPQYKKYLHQSKGRTITNCWIDLPQAAGNEALGYPTQKPVELLKRIVEASSNEGDVVLDPFCGCGTTIAAAQELNRQWIGIDITHLSIALQKYRLKDTFSLSAGTDYQVIGEPVSVASAIQLAQDDPYQFQFWALSLIEARPLGATSGSRKGKKGADRGIDGIINFIDEAKGKSKRVIVQVKGGRVGAAQIRDLVGTVGREDAAIGVFISMNKPTSAMKKEAASAGFYHSPGWNRDYPKIQMYTIEELLNGASVDMPPITITFSQAPKVDGKTGAEQPPLGLE